jgi:biopolymer transport protein TolR
MAETNDVPLSAAQRSRIRRLSEPKEPEPGDIAGELNIVPYLDIITNVMMFVLASVSVTFIATVDTSPPSIGGKGRPDVESKALNLSAFITSQGISLKTSSGNMAPGCNGTGPGITVPGHEEEVEVDEGGTKTREKKTVYDYPALAKCVKLLKNANGGQFKDETQVTITANPGIDYGTIIETMDTLRRDGEEELFPDVHFGVAR